MAVVPVVHVHVQVQVHVPVHVYVHARVYEQSGNTCLLHVFCFVCVVFAKPLPQCCVSCVSLVRVTPSPQVHV